MFDIGFAELLLIGVVGLLVLGPERLPSAIRTGSLWLNRLRRGFNDIKREIEQDMHNQDIMNELRRTGEQLNEETRAITSELEAAEREHAGLTDTVQDPPAAGDAENQAPKTREH
ncbi:MAG: Sec-independent protein translocase protein TatB [Pseudomonadota bacterium]